jgi:hypothetical protein
MGINPDSTDEAVLALSSQPFPFACSSAFLSSSMTGAGSCGRPQSHTRPRNGLLDSSQRRTAGGVLRNTKSVTEIVPMAKSSPGAFGPWESEINRSRRARPGKMPMSNG